MTSFPLFRLLTIQSNFDRALLQAPPTAHAASSNFKIMLTDGPLTIDTATLHLRATEPAHDIKTLIVLFSRSFSYYFRAQSYSKAKKY